MRHRRRSEGLGRQGRGPSGHRQCPGTWGDDAQELVRSLLLAGNQSHTARLLPLFALAARKFGDRVSLPGARRPASFASPRPGQLWLLQPSPSRPRPRQGALPECARASRCVTTTINCCKFPGFKQHVFITLWFTRSSVQRGPGGVIRRGGAGLSRGSRESRLRPFPASRGARPWLTAPAASSLLTLTLPPPSYEHPVRTLGPGNPGSSPLRGLDLVPPVQSPSATWGPGPWAQGGDVFRESLTPPL